MTVATARAADLAALCALDVLLVPRERQDAILAESVARGGCYVARDGATVAAFVTWDDGFFGRPFVRLLVVDAPYRRRGLGSRLIARVERAARPRGELFISTETINAPMRALLARLGYAASGALDHINAPGNPELVFHRELASALPRRGRGRVRAG